MFQFKEIILFFIYDYMYIIALSLKFIKNILIKLYKYMQTQNSVLI